MRPILGGHVPPDQVIGRDKIIQKLWTTLENDSIVLVSERRIGKTSVIWKMHKEPFPGWHAIYIAVEGVRSPTEFISKLSDSIAPILSKKGRMLNRLNRLYEEIAGQKLGSWELPQLKQYWKRLLDAILKDIKENFEGRVVFLWDELPLMISNIKDDHGVKVAMELLDVLRDHRLEDASGKLRMLYTGSIGLHLVVSELLHAGYRNDPTNDMVTFSLEGLEAGYAQELARQGLQGLIDGGELEVSDSVEAIAQTIAESTDGLPFYINHTVDRLAELRRPIKVVDVTATIDSLIMDPEDRAHFGHYAERIEIYYLFGEKAAQLALMILNIICRSEQPMAEDDIWDATITQIELTDKSFFQKTLAMLVKDHYLQRRLQADERAYQFKYNIIRKWWQKNRG